MAPKLVLSGPSRFIMAHQSKGNTAKVLPLSPQPEKKKEKKEPSK